MPIENVEQLRNFISEELDRIRSKDSTPASANAVANLAGKLLKSVEMEVKYSEIVGATPKIGFLDNLEKKVKKLENKSEE